MKVFLNLKSFTDAGLDGQMLYLQIQNWVSLGISNYQDIPEQHRVKVDILSDEAATVMISYTTNKIIVNHQSGSVLEISFEPKITALSVAAESMGLQEYLTSISRDLLNDSADTLIRIMSNDLATATKKWKPISGRIVVQCKPVSSEVQLPVNVRNMISSLFDVIEQIVIYRRINNIALPSVLLASPTLRVGCFKLYFAPLLEA